MTGPSLSSVVVTFTQAAAGTKPAQATPGSRGPTHSSAKTLGLSTATTASKQTLKDRAGNQITLINTYCNPSLGWSHDMKHARTRNEIQPCPTPLIRTYCDPCSRWSNELKHARVQGFATKSSLGPYALQAVLGLQYIIETRGRVYRESGLTMVSLAGIIPLL